MVKRLLVLLVALGLFAAACGSDDSGDSAGTDGTTTTASGSVDEAADESVPTDTADTTAAACDPLPLKNDGQLTVATGEPAFLPWVADDDPTSGEGYEAALVYALAGEMGLDTVDWTRTTFDAAVQPGAKDYDFNLQQYSITPQRDEVVDFSDGYYQVEQAIIGLADSAAAGATTVAELADLKLGAQLNTTSLTYIEDVIQPSTVAAVYDDNVAAKAALDAGQVDAVVFDLPTAYFVTAVEIPDASIIGVLPRSGDAPEELGLLFEDGSPLVPCVNAALGALRDDGTLEALEEEWLSGGGDIPTLTG
ncbi:MAG: ABC transporter substrate-binding protein [Acidimicrobiia bacterium]|nr:ABC transporter substrate-binding protein [Acidimicrobiia bacterium]